MNNHPTTLEQLNKDIYGNPLVCSGCAHSASGAKFPGRPSGERPCCFCTRNVHREQWLAEMSPELQAAIKDGSWTCFYNNAKMKKNPMDCYISTDRVVNDVPNGSSIIT